jgi:hypothetical protein
VIEIFAFVEFEVSLAADRSALSCEEALIVIVVVWFTASTEKATESM